VTKNPTIRKATSLMADSKAIAKTSPPWRSEVSSFRARDDREDARRNEMNSPAAWLPSAGSTGARRWS